MNKTVLVTGGNGFIGRWTISELLHLNYDVHLVSRQSQMNFFGSVENEVTFHQCDFLDERNIHNLISAVQPSHLLHLAWDVTHGQFWTSSNNLNWVQASISLIKSFYEGGGQRLVCAGSCAEYDWKYGCCVEDKTPIKPSTLYGTCKASLSSIITSYSELNNLSSAWGRIFHLYGPFESKSRFMPYLINKMRANENVVCSHGNQLRDFMYVKDVARAFVELLDSNVTGAVNIASGIPVTMKSVVNLVKELTCYTGTIKFNSIKVDENDPMLLIADKQRLQFEVGFESRYNLNDGISETLNYFNK